MLVVGAGGLGCPVLLELARAGVPEVTVADGDVVELSNLHRQLWHREEDLGRLKVESVKSKVESAFPRTRVRALAERIEPDTVDAHFSAHALVIDATDGVETKFMLSDAAVRTGIALVHGGALRMQGQAMLLRPGGPCLRCLFETPPSREDAPSCAQAGVLGTVVGVIGALQARLALSWLGGERSEKSAEAWMHTFDAVALRGRTVKVRRREDCSGCRDARSWAGRAA